MASCNLTSFSWTPNPDYPTGNAKKYLNNTTNMWISIGSLFGILIATHVIVAAISNWKSKHYFKKE